MAIPHSAQAREVSTFEKARLDASRRFVTMTGKSDGQKHDNDDPDQQPNPHHHYTHTPSILFFQSLSHHYSCFYGRLHQQCFFFIFIFANKRQEDQIEKRRHTIFLPVHSNY